MLYDPDEISYDLFGGGVVASNEDIAFKRPVQVLER